MPADLTVVPQRRLDAPSPFLPGVRLLGFTLRGGFILLLAAMVTRANLPQNARFRAVHETPAELMRLALGAILFAWLLWQGLALRERAPVYRAAFCLALAGVPLMLVSLIAIR